MQYHLTGGPLEYSIHAIFYPDKDEKAGFFYYVEKGEYTNTHLCARILIDKTCKVLHIYSVIFDFRYYAFDIEDDIEIKNAGVAVFKTSEFLDEIKSILLKFFDKTWTISFDYNPKRNHDEKRKFRKKINRIEKACNKVFPDHIKDIIAQKFFQWTNDHCVLITPEIKELYDTILCQIRDENTQWSEQYQFYFSSYEFNGKVYPINKK